MPATHRLTPQTLLFVCTGNICRSPFAERLAGARSAPEVGWRFASAGVGALVGARMDPLMAAELARRGGAHEKFVARAFARDLVGQHDLVVTMTSAQRDMLVEDHPSLTTTIFTLTQLRDTLLRLPDLGPGELREQLRSRRAGAAPDGDVPDPIGRGPAAAAASAAQIDEALQQILPRLRTAEVDRGVPR